MREKAHGRRGRRPARRLFLLAGLATGAALVVPGAAFAATTTDPITIVVSYTSPAVNPGAPETVEYAIKNSGSSAEYANFTDQLPSGVTIDALPSESWSSACGINNDTNAGGASTVTVANIDVGAGATCDVTLSVDVAASAVGQTETNTLQSLSWSDTDGGTTTPAADLADDETTTTPLQVVANPTISVSGVTNGATYSYGKLLTATYSATAASGDSIAGLDAFDSFGDTINSGGYLDTLQTGKQTLTVEANSADGASITQNVTFTVARPVLSNVTTSKKGSASYAITLPFAGQLASELLDGKKVVGATRKVIAAAGKAAVTVNLTAAGRSDLKKAGKKGLKLTLRATYTPSSSVATAWPTTATANGFTPGPAVTVQTITIK